MQRDDLDALTRGSETAQQIRGPEIASLANFFQRPAGNRTWDLLGLVDDLEKNSSAIPAGKRYGPKSL
jgi:hypothetical protein